MDAAAVCKFCQSADTIRTDETLAFETRYCYGCRRGFDVRQVESLTVSLLRDRPRVAQPPEHPVLLGVRPRGEIQGVRISQAHTVSKS